VIDLDAGKKVGEIADTQGVHGIAIAPEFNKGFTSNGRSNNVTVFDLKTLQKTGEVATGTNPDAICYEPKTKRVFTFNGRSNDSTAIDAKTGTVVATFMVARSRNSALWMAPERSTPTSRTPARLWRSTRRRPRSPVALKLEPCDAPSGLAIDT